MPQKISPAELDANLAQFTGTSQYYRINPQVVLTDGSKYLADNAGCYWLMDLIASYVTQRNFDSQEFVTINMVVKDRSAVVTLDDGNGNVLATQQIEYTDCPLDQIRLYACRSEEYWVVMLPIEY